MKTLRNVKTLASLIIAFFVIISTVTAQIGAWDPQAEEHAQETISTFKEKNDKMEAYFADSYGYAVFPSIGKGGFVLGGAHGKGIVYEQGESIGSVKMTQITMGFQWGGQDYSEVIFFENEGSLESFKDGDLKFSGQASAVAVTAGASADIAYENGVAVYTLTKAGFMYEATMGGQKFKFRPFEEKATETE